ncbi:MAG: hypothetical protein KDD25_04930 [Bdellovibrionales bacterium]|nr:hypothetical protein [Bdellovibrionales bacterium]
MRYLLFFVLFLSSAKSFGRANVDYSIHQQYISPRAMGMGNTFTGIDDYNVIFYNPALLRVLPEGEVNIGFYLAATPEIQGFYKDVEDATGEGDETEKIEKMADVLDERSGDNYSIRGPELNVFWARPGWGVALVLLDSQINLGIHQAGSPAVGVKAIQDNTLAFGYAWNLNKQKSFNIGATGRLVYRATVDEAYTALDFVDDSEVFREEDLKEGLLFDVDLGLSYTPEFSKTGSFRWLQFMQPTFGLVFRNLLDEAGYIGNQHWISKKSDEEEKPEFSERRVDVGMKLEFPQWWVFTNRLMFDVRDINHRYWSVTKGVHLGYEANWKLSDWFNGGWRVGVNQGYLTGGFTGEFAWFHMDLVTYAEEIGTTDARKENRMYMAKLSLDF